MKIILISIGTRGDMEPFLAIGEILAQEGHQVTCAFPEQFRNLAEEANLEFASLGSKFIEMLESDTGKLAMGGSGSGLMKFLANLKLARKGIEINKELIYRQSEIINGRIPDRVLYNGKAIYPIIWGLKNVGKNILICPVPYMHYAKGHSHVAFNSNYGAVINKLTFSLADFGLVTTIMMSKRWLKIGEKISRREIKKALRSNKAIYTISPSLFSRPEHWSANLKVLGFHERTKTIDWEPDKDLKDFLDKHPRRLLITFGSMTNPDPEKKTRIIIDILEKNKIPAIINTASGGLVRPRNFNSEWIHFVPRIPYDWVFPKVYGVIHHGGSGTTHLALKYGCATMIVPHIIDQFVWNKIVSEMGAGPRGIKAGRISVNNLEPRIIELFNNGSYKKKAEQVAARMKKEEFREELLNSIVN